MSQCHVCRSNISEAAQAPAVRWSSCEIKVMAKLYLRPLLGIKKYSQILNKNISPYFHSASLVIWPLAMLKEPILASYPSLSYHVHKRSPVDLSYVRWGIFIENLTVIFLFLRAVVNIPLQTLIISPWLSISHDDYLTAGAWAACVLLWHFSVKTNKIVNFLSSFLFVAYSRGKMMILRVRSFWWPLGVRGKSY